MKITITGGAGYIGSILTPELLKKGHKVTVVDSFLYKQSSLLNCAHDDNLEIIRGDARDENIISKAIEGADVIIPLACIVGAPACALDPHAAKTINLDAVKLILKLRKPEQKIVFPSTNSGYGSMPEGAAYCDENSPQNPVSLYGRLKVEAETELFKAGNAVVIRLATVFGPSPRMRMDLLVNDFVYRAVNDRAVVLFEAHFKRNYINIRDVARAFMHIIDNFESMKNEVYNLGLSDANLSKKELCEEIKKQLPKFVFMESEIGEDPDKRNYIISNEKIEKTGFKTTVSIGDGIKHLIKAYNVVRVDQYRNF